MKEVSFTIPGEPQGKGRPRFARVENAVRTYTPAQTANYENLIKVSYLQEYPYKENMLHGAIRAKIVGVFPVPKSTSKKKAAAMLSGDIHHTKKIDCDNLAKTILDALNGIAYPDDKQVFRLEVEKRYGDQPRVEVTLSEIAKE